MKRHLPTEDREVSPPPLKRKVESGMTNKAVSNFFTPVSKKEPEKLTWAIRDHSLIVGSFNVPQHHNIELKKPVKVAAFDLDGTLVKPKPGVGRFTRNGNSHQWWDASVPAKLQDLHENGYSIVIMSNQSRISLKDNAKSMQKDSQSLKNFKDQLAMSLRPFEFPVSIFAATENDKYRKPRPGMWHAMLEHFDISQSSDLDMENSFYVGDAAGRKIKDSQKDHSTCDRDLAANLKVKFQTPEEFFLGLPTEPYHHPFEPRAFLESQLDSKPATEPFRKAHKQELVIFSGSPGSGKSSFFAKYLQPQGYERVNQDKLGSRVKCIKVAKEHLRLGESVVVDNTNRDREARAHWTSVAAEFKIPIRCILFTAPARLCEHNDSVRAHLRERNPEARTILPAIAFTSFAKAYQRPSLDEGFADITVIDFEFEGDDKYKESWCRYWVSKFST